MHSVTTQALVGPASIWYIEGMVVTHPNRTNLLSNIKLSAVVIAQNSAPVMERCLESLQFADEIVVVDALSHDGTPEIARRYGARVVSKRWPGFPVQYQFAID